MKSFALYITSQGAYAGDVLSLDSTFEFFRHPEDLAHSQMMTHVKQSSSSIPIYIYLDSQNESFDGEDLSALNGSDTASYIKNQRKSRKRPHMWVIPFQLTPSHILWIHIDHAPMSQWLLTCHALSHPIKRITSVPLEIGALISRDHWKNPTTLISYNDTNVGHRQVVLVGHIFYMTRLLSHSLSHGEHEIKQTQTYLYNRLHLKEDSLDLVFLNRSPHYIAHDLLSHTPLLDLRPFISHKKPGTFLMGWLNIIGWGATMLGFCLMCHLLWLKNTYSQHIQHYVALDPPISSHLSPQSMDRLNELVRTAQTSKAYLLAYLEHLLPHISSKFVIYSCTWHQQVSEEIMVIRLSSQKNRSPTQVSNALHGFFDGKAYRPQIAYDPATEVYTVTLMSPRIGYKLL